MYLYEITLLSNCTMKQPLGIDVLYLYEITLLSNCCALCIDFFVVLYLYEITLLSNNKRPASIFDRVLYLYEITLLSNAERRTFYAMLGFVPLRNYTTLKPNDNSDLSGNGFVPLRNYTTLKPIPGTRSHQAVLYLYEITLLSNTSEQEQEQETVLYLYEITLLSNLKFCFHIRVNTRKKRLRAAGSESDKCKSLLIF